MNEILLWKQTVSPADRLMVTVSFAVVIHILIIIGIRFDFAKGERIQKSLEIVLVDNPTRAAPADMDFPAQANRIDRGTERKIAEPQRAAIPSAGVRRPQPRPTVLAKAAKKQANRVLTQKNAESKIDSAEKEVAASSVDRPELTAAGLHKQIAALGAEIALANDRKSKRVRIQFIDSVNADQYKAAAYEKAWQYKVERIGNLNYPDQARREHLSGSLLLAVAVRRDGSIYRIEVRRSSGKKALDDGAIRIVRLAAPFAPFPTDLAANADVLVITRTWKFSDDTQVTTSR